MLRVDDVDEIEITPTTDKTLRPYSHSMLNAIATCPVKGLVTYHANRVMSAPGRAMALEAGSAAHECYAAARLWQVGMVQDYYDHMLHHGVRLFGEDRLANMRDAAGEAGDDERNAMLRFCLEAFYSSGFYDDPSDNRRTWVNIEEALIAYLDRFDFKRNVWVENVDDPTSRVGIEIPIDITLTYKSVRLHEPLQIRFVGTADGLTVRKDEYRLEENKTASRLGEAWAMAWHTSHQQTGYLLGLSSSLGISINKCAVHGMALPLPRSYDAGGIMIEVVNRKPQQYKDFLAWVLHLVQIIDLYGDKPHYAPQHTNACNNYFRPCSLVPLCASDTEDRDEFYEMMVERPNTPTEDALEE